MAMGLWHADESRVRKWEKYPGHPVCEVDIEADRLLRERLTVIDPGAAWLSEETADDLVRLSPERIWVVDPIDGTRDYLRGRRGWAGCVALGETGEPVLGRRDGRALSGERVGQHRELMGVAEESTRKHKAK